MACSSITVNGSDPPGPPGPGNDGDRKEAGSGRDQKWSGYTPTARELIIDQAYDLLLLEAEADGPVKYSRAANAGGEADGADAERSDLDPRPDRRMVPPSDCVDAHGVPGANAGFWYTDHLSVTPPLPPPPRAPAFLRLDPGQGRHGHDRIHGSVFWGGTDDMQC